jgi:hypothetical protein
MLQITKIFRFESAHAIGGYPGRCNNLRLPQGLSLKKLKLFETADSYAEWEEN